MRQPRQLDALNLGSDWVFSWRVLDLTAWDDDDEVVLTMDPDGMMYEDYGMHSRTYPTSEDVSTHWFQASSADDTDYVALTDPNIVDLYVPYHLLNPMGPGGVNVHLNYRRLDTDRRTMLLSARLPLVV